MSIRFSLRQLLLAVLIVGLLTPLAAFVVRILRSDATKIEVGEICFANGGGYTFDLVDERMYLNLSKATLSEDEMRRLSYLTRRCHTSLFFAPCEIYLDLSHSRLEGDLGLLLHKNVIGLSLDGLALDDRDLAKIVAICPRLVALSVNGCPVTDASIGLLKALPLRSLSVRGTELSPTALRQLADCRSLCNLNVDLTDGELRTLQKHLSWRQISRDPKFPALRY